MLSCGAVAWPGVGRRCSACGCGWWRSALVGRRLVLQPAQPGREGSWLVLLRELRPDGALRRTNGARTDRQIDRQ